ncbi:MAG: hypothetical protein ACJ788_24570, partial [Ktedonobacteraceae bacterium]
GAYGISGYDGSGQTVAIIDAYAAPTIVQDVNQWSINRGLPTMKPGQFSQVVAPGTYRHPERGLKQDPQGWYGEETLDVEAVHGMAPAANIVYVGSPNNFQDLDAALNHVVDRHLAQIVTNSYGFNTEALPSGYIKPLEDTILQGVSEGIGIYFSSGDNSDESLVTGSRTTDWPASSPFVTAVGGTSLAVGASNKYLFETGWGSTTSSWKGNTWSPTPRTLALWCGWRRQPDLRRAVLPGWSRATLRVHGTGPHWSGRTRYRRLWRSQRRLPDRRDPNIPRRYGQVLGVSHRRHQPVKPHHGWHHGAGGPGCWSSTWIRKSGLL